MPYMPMKYFKNTTLFSGILLHLRGRVQRLVGPSHGRVRRCLPHASTPLRARLRVLHQVSQVETGGKTLKYTENMFNIDGGSFLVSRFSSSAVPLIVSDQTKGTVLLEMVEKNNTVHIGTLQCLRTFILCFRTRPAASTSSTTFAKVSTTTGLPRKQLRSQTYVGKGGEGWGIPLG